MALFEFEGGRLIPAQFGHTVASGLTPELVDAICSQVLEIVARPLFPITWRELSRLPVEGDSPRLTALDVTGQVVSVEVVATLDSDTLISSLSRLADAAALSWADLAREYEGGIEAFKNGWLEFRDSMPPSSGAGPRLVMVVGSIDPQVRPALDVLASSGVEVHEAGLRRMSNGRIFLEVTAVGPRLYGHAPQLLVGQSATAAVLPASAMDEDEALSAPGGAAVEDADAERLAEGAPADVPGSVAEDSGDAAPGPDLEGPDVEAPADAEPDGEPMEEEQEGAPAQEKGSARPEHAAAQPLPEADDLAAAREAGVPLLSRDADGLKVLAALIGEPIPLVAHEDCGAPDDLLLDAEGVISSRLGTWTSPTQIEALAPGLADAWDHLRVADPSGPTLAESIDEVNRDMIREYSRTSGPTRGRHAAKD